MAAINPKSKKQESSSALKWVQEVKDRYVEAIATPKRSSYERELRAESIAEKIKERRRAQSMVLVEIEPKQRRRGLICSLFIFTTSIFCLHTQAQTAQPINLRLAHQIDSMYVLDQLPYQQLMQKIIPQDSVESQSHRAYRRNYTELRKILQRHKYPSYALVGPETTQRFNTMVLHCFFDVPFQNTVLELFRQEAAEQPKLLADKRYLRDLAYLTDKVLSNSGKPQLYGTQIEYSPERGAFLRPIQDATTLNKRRAQMQLEPIEEYLKRATEVHQQLNAQQKH